MPEPAFEQLMRYFWLVAVAVIAGNLAYGKYRARALIEAGIATADEVSNFVRSAFTLLGGVFVAFGVIQTLAPTPDPYCLMRFPPATIAGTTLWAVQMLLSGTVVWWLWVRNGHELLARLAPAFTSGEVLNRRYSATRVRLAVTALVIGAPLMNIAIQHIQPKVLWLCQAT